MKKIITLVVAMFFVGCATASHNTVSKKQENINHAYHNNHDMPIHFTDDFMHTHEEHVMNHDMMQNFQLRSMPEIELKSDIKNSNDVEKAILKEFKDKVIAVAYIKYGASRGVDLEIKEPINRITFRKLGVKIADLVRQVTDKDGLIEINSKINGIQVSKFL
ncbi:hypothetical protein BB381_04325 [Campylobacter pinnipediorum subsp. caledonicus]|uniref:hypothetical protein n=1 Tax=Campylobacter pinnipediorum TaxID=1965231 RepID=UPI00099584F2|nr:hypothetical protein [Campylobacter pinnipediorum]AQW86622.1 hypothetical protein CPIN18020_1439 [Campylobacter pinnipediorum subsp. caledonicus]OPA70588.1 hypothetical protein BB381_04325 [Campylobacter pinnipediorum subsp. caledonicus]